LETNRENTEKIMTNYEKQNENKEKIMNNIAKTMKTMMKSYGKKQRKQ